MLLGLSALWCALWFVHALGYWEDDAYIHLEFARSLAGGQGFSFNGHVVYGDTSPLWVWLLVAFHAFIPHWMAAGKTLSACAAVFALAGAFVFARSLTRAWLGASAAHLFAAAMVLVFVVNPFFGYWAFSGMEALAAAGLACWAAAAVAPRNLSPLRFLTACVLGGIAPLLRPEMAFFTILLGLILLERLPRVLPGLAQRMLLFCAGLAWLLLPFLSWARYAVHTFGSVLPNTNAAKRAAPHDSVLFHLFAIYLLGFPLVLIGLTLLLAWALWWVLRGRHRGPSLLPLLHPGGWVLLVWTAVASIFYIADHTYVQTRYIFVTAPVLTISLLALAMLGWPRLGRALTGFGVLFGIGISFLSTWPLVTNKIQVDRVYAQLADQLRALPPNAPVAHYSIGEAAFLSQHPIIDTGGITRPAIIPLLNDPTDERRLAWIYSQGAQYIVIDHSPVPGSMLLWSSDIPTTGWFLNRRRYAETAKIDLWKLPPPPARP
jgi:hypothetical protein